MAHLVIKNPSGYTEELEKDHVLGVACPVEVLDPSLEPPHPSEDTPSLPAYTPGDHARWQERLQELVDIERSDISQEDRASLLELLLENHGAFKLEEGERERRDRPGPV